MQVKRLFDILMSMLVLFLASPLLLLVFIGIKIQSPGPVLYISKRVGYNGKIFKMYKFRTMHIEHGDISSVITSKDDPRVFGLGCWLRKLKIDEIPQLINVLKGEMSIVGPRPEDPWIVEKKYAPQHYETLSILPGLASPGSIYNYTHGEKLLEAGNTEDIYIRKLLPVKLALDIVYVRKRSFIYDLKIIWRTIAVIWLIFWGKRMFNDPPELREARILVENASGLS